MKKIIMSVLTCVLFTGCSTVYKKPPINQPSDDATIKLAEAAGSVSDSMLQMARVEKVITPPSKDNTLTIPNTYALSTRASVDWSGPIEELARRVANGAHYRFNALGREPAIPILISVNAKDKSLAEILRDIDYQAGKKADIHVYPNSELVELRYAKIHS